MRWSEETMTSLRQWVCPDTAHTNHPADEARFFVFIGGVWKDQKGIWDESLARDIIKRELKSQHPDWSLELIEQIAEDGRSKGTLILDFLSTLRDKNKLSILAG
jgi:hypothetical protein